MTTMPVQIAYNDEFDREHHPLTDWHKETVARIAEHFKIPMDVPWYYHATIQGAVFWPKTNPPRLARLHAEEARFLADLPGFRWVEYGAELKFGLAHREPR